MGYEHDERCSQMQQKKGALPLFCFIIDFRILQCQFVDGFDIFGGELYKASNAGALA